MKRMTCAATLFLFLFCAQAALAQDSPQPAPIVQPSRATAPIPVGYMRINRLGFHACIPIYSGMQPVNIDARVGLFGLRHAQYTAR